MKRVGIIYLFIGMAMAFVLAACSDRFSDDFTQRYGRDEILVATIAGDDGVGTRVLKSSLDHWSFTRFSETSDVIGFYSRSGNLDSPDGNGPFTNEPMEYARGEQTSSRPDDRYWRGVFRPLHMNYDLALIKNDVQNTFVYFPYCEQMEEEGMELRILGEDGIYRCVDALTISKVSADDDAMMSGSFYHTFSELVIIRGYGFDKPKPGLEKIKVVTTLPYSHAEVQENTNKGHDDWKILKPVYKDSYTLSEQACREWEAWEGADYVDDSGKSHPAKYVIIPTAISTDRSTVNYVEIYDNNGTLHKVTTFGLMNDTDKRVSPNERYWLTVKLEGLVPTIYPFAITPWEKTTSHTEQRARGINTAAEFLDFVMAYNRYNDLGRQKGDEEALKNFGDRYEVADDVRWHFHINNDFDLSSLGGVEKLLIPTLCDTLDGRTKTLSGIKSDQAFITELQAKGCIRNLNVSGLNVTSTSGSYAGGLIGSMTGGLVTGCNVDGYLNAKGAAGLAVGQFTAGTISNSSFSGLVVGTSSFHNESYDEGLVGEVTNGILPEMIKSVNTSGLIFQTGN